MSDEVLEEMFVETPVRDTTPEEDKEFYDSLATYRKLNAEIKALSKTLGTLKPVIQRGVEARGGKFQDDSGYARMVVRSESVSFPGQQVNSLVETWAKSEDPIMRSCGQMLINLRKLTSASTYLQVK